MKLSQPIRSTLVYNYCCSTINYFRSVTTENKTPQSILIESRLRNIRGEYFIINSNSRTLRIRDQRPIGKLQTVLIHLKTLKASRFSTVRLCLAILPYYALPLKRVISKSYRNASLAKREQSIIEDKLAGIKQVPAPLQQQGKYSEQLIYEYLSGRPLHEHYAEIQESTKRALGLMRSMLEIVNIVHSREVLHNDLSPGNFILNSNNSLSLIDFGSATVYRCSEFRALGKPHYASPEQISDQTCDSRSDLFQLGCVLFEMIHRVQYQSETNRPYRPIEHLGNSPIDSLLKSMLAPALSKRITSAQECINIIDNIIYDGLV